MKPLISLILGLVLTLALFPSTVKATQLEILGDWSSEEVAQVQRFYQGLPLDFKMLAGPLKLAKTPTPLPDDPQEIGGSFKGNIYSIPIYLETIINQKKEQLDSFEKAERQAWEGVFSQNLVASPEGKKNHYIAYLKREVARAVALAALKSDQKHLSEQWLSLTPWQEGWFGYSTKNKGLRAFAEPRGMASPKEDLASTLATFLAPPLSLFEDSIRCRMPAKYEFAYLLFPNYQSPLNHLEFKKRGIRCMHEEWRQNSSITMRDIYNGKTIDFGPLNEKTLDGFELLYATPGDREVSEIAGHLLLRIRLKNNPSAANTGMENPYDLVISFLADSRNFEVPPSVLPVDQTAECKRGKKEFSSQMDEGLTAMFSALKGLSGQFPSMVQIDSLQYIQHHYAVIGNRTLKRYRLKLTKAQELRLLSRLIRAKLNHEQNYWFFTQNCGAILQQIIGQGLENEKIMNFSPLVASPNLLLAELDREGLITEVSPEVPSFWSKAYRAREWIVAKIKLLESDFPTRLWPQPEALFNKDASLRVLGLKGLVEQLKAEPQPRAIVIEILQMFPQAELYFSWDEDGCLDYRSEPKAVARKYLQELTKDGNFTALDTGHELQIWRLEEQKALERKGSSHTGYLNFSLGRASHSYPTGDTKEYRLFEGNFFSQELGDSSYRALGRSSGVQLGQISLEVDENNEIQKARVKALQIHKVKEVLQGTPSVFQGNVKMGIGLTALAVDYDSWSYIPKQTRLLEGEALFNVLSSNGYEDHLMASAAIAWVQPWDHDTPAGSRLLSGGGLVSVPFRLAGLVTFGPGRNLQIRPKAEWDLLFSGGELALKRSNIGVKSLLRLWPNQALESQLILEFKREKEEGAQSGSQNKRSQQRDIAALRLGFFFW